MLVLKNVGSNKTIGVMKRVFDLGYDIIQNEMNNLEVDCDTAFNLCVLYYNEFYHSKYNKNNMSEYSALTDFYNDDEIFLREWLKRIQLMFQICQYYEYTLSFDVENMKICLFNNSKKYYNPSQFQYNYNTIEEFALGWITTCIQTNNKLTVWTNEDLNVSINYSNKNYTNQYKIDNGEWQTATLSNNLATISVSENGIIYFMNAQVSHTSEEYKCIWVLRKFGTIRF